MVLQLLLFGENNMGLRYHAYDHPLDRQWRKVALNVLRRLRYDCLNESKCGAEDRCDSSVSGAVYIETSRHLQYWCDAAGVSKTGYVRRLKRDINTKNALRKIT